MLAGVRFARFADRMTNAFGLVLLLILLTYVLISVTSYRGWAGALTSVVAATTATVGLTTARARLSVVHWAVRAALVAVALGIAAAASGEQALLGFSALIQVLLLSAAAIAVLRAVMTETHVGFRTILGAISVYLSLALLFTYLYVALDRLESSPFFGTTKLGTGDFVFFSITTLTTAISSRPGSRARCSRGSRCSSARCSW